MGARLASDTAQTVGATGALTGARTGILDKKDRQSSGASETAQTSLARPPPFARLPSDLSQQATGALTGARTGILDKKKEAEQRCEPHRPDPPCPTPPRLPDSPCHRLFG